MPYDEPMSSDFAGDDPTRSPGPAEAVEAVEAAQAVEATSDRDPWLSPQERAAWLTLHALLLKLPGRLDQQLQRDADLSYFEYLVLAVLAECSPPRLRMSQLSILTSGSLSRLSHVAKRLESKNYIVRETDEFDRRSTNAALTAEGLAKVRDAAPAHVAWVRHLVFDHLSDAQVGQVTAFGKAVLPSIDPDGDVPTRGA